MTQALNLEFIDNPVVASRRDHYVDVTVDTAKILKSWQSSLYSFEWMLPDGRIKTRDELPPAEQPKRDDIENRLKTGAKLEKPVLGIGLLENIEIGSGRALFLTLAAHGIKTVPVHIPKSNAEEFSIFLVK